MKTLDQQARRWQQMAFAYLEERAPHIELEIATEEFTSDDCPNEYIEFKTNHTSTSLHYTQSDADLFEALSRMLETNA